VGGGVDAGMRGRLDAGVVGRDARVVRGNAAVRVHADAGVVALAGARGQGGVGPGWKLAGAACGGVGGDAHDDDIVVDQWLSRRMPHARVQVGGRVVRVVAQRRVGPHTHRVRVRVRGHLLAVGGREAEPVGRCLLGSARVYDAPPCNAHRAGLVLALLGRRRAAGGRRRSGRVVQRRRDHVVLRAERHAGVCAKDERERHHRRGGAGQHARPCALR
jgi:hypothetical protein